MQEKEEEEKKGWRVRVKENRTITQRRKYFILYFICTEVIKTLTLIHIKNLSLRQTTEIYLNSSAI